MEFTNSQPALRLANVQDGETIHQRCLLVTGTCTPSGPGDFISVKTTGANGLEVFPEQTWPVHSSHFKALVMLSPGANTLDFSHMGQDGQAESIKISLLYIPLLQHPPLHLAIMVAKDSPLLMDCPPQKAGGLSSAHSDLSAAIEKFRMTAYMWQAMTAEDMRTRGLGRRTFRLEEEWTADTVSRDFINARHSEHYVCNSEDAIRSTARVTIVRSSKTKKEILYAEGKDTTPMSNNGLFDIFMEALADHVGHFDPSSSPVVAGLILDAHYNKCTEQAFTHVSAGRHNSSGISLGTFGSHLTYSWPRFTEEVSSCLTDARIPGPKISRGQSTIWESCAFGQSSFLSAVGLAFGANANSHEQRDQCAMAQDWRGKFLSSADTLGGPSEDVEVAGCSTLDLKDALNLRLSRHFLLPTDKSFTDAQRTAEPAAEPKFTDNEQGELDVVLRVTSAVGIARISFNQTPECTPSIDSPANEHEYTQDQLEQRFDRSQPLRLDILGLNGKELTIANVWETLTVKTFVRIPGSPIRLFKRSVYTDAVETNSASTCDWAQLLKERGPDGVVYRATSIDLRVGCWWDGGVITYEDGHKSHWGPMCTGGREHSFGGHASQIIDLPPGINIKRIEVNRGHNASYMRGVKVRLADRTVRGELNARRGDGANVVRLEPASHEVIVGFYGKSGNSDGVMEFGIITVAKTVGLEGLPDAVFGLPELRNTVGMGEDERNGDQDDGDDHTIDGDGDDE
ncbi:uncharacterized protein M421DRAFT_418865 [Didymella exigua CBS 183.55]|uniref:Jacalin-type lectin domain-containing protein n=1 Tax=Didymella exigua CBS 183.55 TaxID=1150837 RepID=A0A6A5RSX3_9PLEO|nr:uncharacterized protein M421DRAFT_418865 [Didymella exigua CBS 183.55]KAF1930563.1 hypothetical protein M421DRAFT_418865 [Didymella exigua CBS 183.55]